MIGGLVLLICAFTFYVDSDCIWPSQSWRYNSPPAWTVHVGFLYLSCLTPISPKYFAEKKKKSEVNVQDSKIVLGDEQNHHLHSLGQHKTSVKRSSRWGWLHAYLRRFFRACA